MSINKRIREQRIINEWTQPQLAKRLSVSIDMVKSLEIGRTMPSIETLTKLSDIFGCTTDYLLGRTDDQDEDVGDNISNNDLMAIIETSDKILDNERVLVHLSEGQVEQLIRLKEVSVTLLNTRKSKDPQ